MKTKPFRVAAAALFVAVGVFAVPTKAHAQVATVCVNCGSEITQYLNFAELFTQTATQASSLAESVQQTIAQINQYAAMVQNLQQLPAAAIGQLLGPYQSQVADLSKLYSASTSLYNSAMQAHGMVNNNMQSATAMNLSPTQYTQYIIDQARTRGGVYQQMAADNNAKLQNLQQTSTAFQNAAANIPSIQGNLDGIQAVATLAAASGQVATEMLADQKTALSMTLQQRMEDANEAGRQLQLRQQSVDDLNANLDTMGNGLKAKKVWR